LNKEKDGSKEICYRLFKVVIQKVRKLFERKHKKMLEYQGFSI